MITIDIPRYINNTFNYDSFALENKMMITKDILRKLIPRKLYFNYCFYPCLMRTYFFQNEHVNTRCVLYTEFFI